MQKSEIFAAEGQFYERQQLISSIFHSVNVAVRSTPVREDKTQNLNPGSFFPGSDNSVRYL